jgi:hypothetical protein
MLPEPSLPPQAANPNKTTVVATAMILAIELSTPLPTKRSASQDARTIPT